MIACVRQSGEARQFGQGHIHAERTRARGVAAHPFGEVRRNHGRIDQAVEQQTRVQVGDHGPGADCVARLGHGADRPALFHQHLGDRRVQPDVDALLGAGGRHGLSDGAHAADGMAPGALLAVHLAKDVVQQDIGRTGRIGTGVVADDAVETEQGLDRIALEPPVQPVARRLGEQVQQIALRRQTQARDPPPQGRRLQHLRQGGQPTTLDDVGRRGQDQVTQDGGDRLQPRLIIGQALGVAH